MPDDAQQMAATRWSNGPFYRLFGVFCAGILIVLGALLAVDGVAISDHVGGVVMLVVGPIGWWLVFWRPYIAIERDHLVIRNSLRCYLIPWAEIADVDAGGYWGLTVQRQPPLKRVASLAARKDNISGILGWHTRSDDIADAIRQAMSAPPTAASASAAVTMTTPDASHLGHVRRFARACALAAIGLGVVGVVLLAVGTTVGGVILVILGVADGAFGLYLTRVANRTIAPS